MNRKRVSTTCMVIMACIGMAGCSHQAAIGVRSANVERIPTRLALYPLLSVPLYPLGPRGPLPDIGFHRGRGESPDTAHLFVTAPVSTQLQITESSEIFGGLLALNLAGHGFELSEMPLALMAARIDESGHVRGLPQVAPTLEALDRLRARGVEAFLGGTVFFAKIHQVGSRLHKREVVAAHIKVIDIESLDVLAQVNLPYDHSGRELYAASRELGAVLARLAGLEPLK